MGWYSLYKWFVPWRKTKFINLISWYKHYLYRAWFCSLSEDEQKVEAERRKIKSERSDKAYKTALVELALMTQFMSSASRKDISLFNDRRL